MSKNTGANRFRKVNVDQYDEDRFQEDDNDDSEQGPNESEVQSLLTQNKNVDALKVILNNAPLATKNQQVKDRALGLAVRVLLAFKASEIDGAVKSLDTVNIDILMKYIYRGFERAQDNNTGILLTWHEKVFAVGGLGSIMRVLTDRKKV
ncbi:actin-related protein 2/3 complex subunit 5 [Patella vulgata]|uniref:actin-related protein 2/3 complex subunit 5 n=1 Tax=Patella vulgata TaxID=6465 RepID=UPI00217FD75E|nr:actin-related protein 2/3 complex subunit 5 [Patella vulgata]